MALEDIAMFRTIPDSVVLYPSDAVATERLVEEMAMHHGIAYLRSTRGKTPVIYNNDESFPIGGCKILRQSDTDQAVVVAAGVTIHEALKAYDQLQADGIRIRVIDLYSIKPVDTQTLLTAATATGFVLTVEDHYAEGGLGDAVRTALAESGTPVRALAVRHRPRSGSPEELREDQGISARAIIEAITNTHQHQGE